MFTSLVKWCVSTKTSYNICYELIPVDNSDLVIVLPGAVSHPLGHVFPPGQVQISVVVSYMVSFLSICPFRPGLAEIVLSA